ncbi:hypothetical protein [Devosia sp. SL43]|uniref:hypothetical protein n=1 Tax=Devosia sp. SL43 TaxID=2806348 RepID=UPI001F3BBA6A|nr:hypothetical protein [Devosia sp. SL43]UJW86114.1 hypothetical protein IM737_02180 [Devosia sp. SL43]
MKLTWFGGTTVRIHIGGSILVIDADRAPAGIDAAELVSGADTVVHGFGAELALVDTAAWAPRKAPRVLDEADHLPVVEVWSAGAGAVLVDAVGEPPLLLIAGEVPPLARWAESAVVALFGDGAGLSRMGLALLAETAPRLIALAGDEAAIDAAISAIRGALDGTGVVSLEAGLAVEV